MTKLSLTPPKPPEHRISCSSCGFTAPASKYAEQHPYCFYGRIIISVVVVGVIIWATFLIFTVWTRIT